MLEVSKASMSVRQHVSRREAAVLLPQRAANKSRHRLRPNVTDMFLPHSGVLARSTLQTFVLCAASCACLLGAALLINLVEAYPS